MIFLIKITFSSTDLVCDLFSQQIKSSICLLRGKIYDALDNPTSATYSHKEALKLDVYCFEAFDLLTPHHMLTAQEGLDTQVFLCLAQLILFFFFLKFIDSIAGYVQVSSKPVHFPAHVFRREACTTGN